MKILSILSASLVTAALIGCASEPRHMSMTEPSVKIVTTHQTVMVGESTRLLAHTMDVAGSSAVQWKVSPSGAKIQTDTKSGESALFSADQPGTYILNAMVQSPDGNWVTSPDITITVNGRLSSDK